MQYSWPLKSVVLVRPDPPWDGAKIGHGVPFFKELLQTGRPLRQTKCTAMIYKHVEEVLLFLVPFWSQIFDAFWRLFGPLTVNQVNHTSWVAVVTPTHHPKSVCNRYVIELFVALFVLSLCPFDISVGVGAFVIGLSQISSFFSSSHFGIF